MALGASLRIVTAVVFRVQIAAGRIAVFAKAIGLISNSHLVTGLAVPLCVGAVWYAMRRLRRSLEHS